MVIILILIITAEPVNDPADFSAASPMADSDPARDPVKEEVPSTYPAEALGAESSADTVPEAEGSALLAT